MREPNHVSVDAMCLHIPAPSKKKRLVTTSEIGSDFVSLLPLYSISGPLDSSNEFLEVSLQILVDILCVQLSS